MHLIVASRDRFLPAAETVRLGARVYQIGTEQLRLNHTELAVYAHRCGTELTDEQVADLLYSSEGWFSAQLPEDGDADAAALLGALRRLVRAA